jgi:predicted PurR-regulated permease PerM
MGEFSVNRLSENGVQPDGLSARRSWWEFTRRVLIATGVIGLAVLIGAIFAKTYALLCLFFLGILLAILLRAASDALNRYTRLGAGPSLAVVVLALLGLVAGCCYAAGAMVIGQLDRLSANLPIALNHAQDYLRQHDWGRRVLGHVPSADSLSVKNADGVYATAASFFSFAFGVLTNLVVLIVLTIYLAATPRMYVDGLLTLVPHARRERGGEVLAAVGYHLRWWMIGQLVAMLSVGLITFLGLWLVGVPQFVILSLIAALFTAVPYIGSILSVIPAVLLALLVGPTAVLWTLVIYAVAHAVEGYIISPLVQQQTVRMPPALTIAAIALGGVLIGVWGVIVATPLAVVVLVSVKMLYVEDVLGKRLDVPGAEPQPVPS